MTSYFPAPPPFHPCGATAPPSLPDKFHAIALLTPFNNSQLVVANIEYDWTVKTMRVTTYGLEQGYADFLYTPEGYYILDSVNGGPPKHYYGPIATTEEVPAPDWLTNYKVTCNGTQTVLGVETNWWCNLTPNKNGLAPFPPMKKCPPFDSANWFWMRSDNHLPWRMMFINTTNDYKLPFIGRFAFVNFPTFKAISSTPLPEIVEQATVQAQDLGQVDQSEIDDNLLEMMQFLREPIEQSQIQEQIQNLIPGLTPPDNNPLPSWPPTLFMTALATPTFEPQDFPNQPYPSQVFYDWPKRRQLTRFFLPNHTVQDLILTETQTYVVLRLPDGTHQCKKPNVPVGLPYPDWPTRAGGQCRGVITNNPQLSPNKTTQIYVLPSQPPRFFWIWYTDTNEAIMFTEVPQCCNVELILTEYFDYNPSPPSFDPSLFEIPQDCLDQD